MDKKFDEEVEGNKFKVKVNSVMQTAECELSIAVAMVRAVAGKSS